VRGQSIQPYLAAADAQHRCMEKPDPTVHNLVQLTRRSFAAAEARRRSGAPMRSVAYPAAAAVFCLVSALAAADSRVLCYWAVVSVRF
jgi:hypothetical protein